ncbi:MAG: outer membrane beta-barrel protein [Pedobacter sp.]|nr:outer membrane beta-barrel protein [Pedobacter sp.]
MRSSVWVAVLMLVCGAGAANAAEDSGRFYVVGSLGLDRYDTDEIEQAMNEHAAIYNSILGVSAYANSDELGFTFSAGGGYQFNSWVALEGFYRGYGKAEPELYAANSMGAYISERVMLKSSGFGLGVVGTWPVTPAFSLLARVDGVNLKSEAEFHRSSTLGASYNYSADDTSFTPGFGLGFQYDYGYDFLVRGEYQRIEADMEFPDGATTSAIDSLSLSVLMAF